MKPFDYAAPDTVEDAIGLLSGAWGECEIHAGGTDLITCLKQGLSSPKRLVSLRNIGGLRGVAEDDGALRVGAMTTLKALAADANVARHFPAITTAVQGIGAAQITSVGTLGGDLCQRPRCWYFRSGHGLFGEENGQPLVEAGDNRYHAIFGNAGRAKFVSASSLGPVLAVLDAQAEIAGPEGARTVSVAEFFRTPAAPEERETVLAPNEILTHVVIPLRGLKNACYEVRHRAGLDWPYVTAAVASGEGYGAVCLGHVAPTPWMRPEAGALLAGGTLDATTAAKAGEAAAEGATPLSGNGYKVAMVKTAVKRAVLAAAATA